jgi:hypothetical protein
MAGLIPLMLRPVAEGNRTSVVFQSDNLRQSGSSSPRPRSAQKRLSQATPSTLPVLPYTRAEWRKAISEIKAQHISRRYRACSARCAEILGNLKDVSQVEPVYLIYLHFYAAASMEMCTRPLPLTSPYRISLLQQARAHYERATSLIQAAEDSVATKTRSSSSTSSRSSFFHSPSSSLSSRTWTIDTSMSSPTNSICSFEDLAARRSQSPRHQRPCSASPKRVKKVSFSLPCSLPSPTTLHSPSPSACSPNPLPSPSRLSSRADFRFPEPIIRPDSPTLGFDDEYFHTGAALRELPELPKPKIMELPLKPESDLLRQEDDEEDAEFHIIERSVHRYNETLSSLRAQLARHSENLQALLNRSTSAQASEMLLLSEAGRSRVSVSPTSATSAAATTFGKRSSSLPQGQLLSPASPASLRTSTSSADLRALDKQARIERLRKTGWQRKRFDAARSERLAEEVLAELA